MDNWGEGVVPACREERPERLVFVFHCGMHSPCYLSSSLEQPPQPIAERPATAPLILSTSEDVDRIQRPFTGSSVGSSTQTPLSQSQAKKLPKLRPSDSIHSSNQRDKSIKTDSDARTLTHKESSTEQTTSRSSFEQRPYYHDVLVINNQPLRVIFCYHESKRKQIFSLFTA